jgi:hypothetical protein
LSRQFCSPSLAQAAAAGTIGGGLSISFIAKLMDRTAKSTAMKISVIPQE